MTADRNASIRERLIAELRDMSEAELTHVATAAEYIIARIARQRGEVASYEEYFARERDASSERRP